MGCAKVWEEKSRSGPGGVIEKGLSLPRLALVLSWHRSPSLQAVSAMAPCSSGEPQKLFARRVTGPSSALRNVLAGRGALRHTFIFAFASSPPRTAVPVGQRWCDARGRSTFPLPGKGYWLNVLDSLCLRRPVQAMLFCLYPREPLFVQLRRKSAQMPTMTPRKNSFWPHDRPW